MRVQFFDREDDANPLNGKYLEDLAGLRRVLEGARNRPPFFGELIGDNGFSLLLGLGGTEGCVQFSSIDGSPPHLMAVAASPRDPDGEVEFLIGGTATPILRRYCIPYDVVERIALEFVETGQRKEDERWEEI